MMAKLTSFVCMAMLCVTMVPQGIYAETTTYESYTEVLSDNDLGYRMRVAGTTDKGDICYCYHHDNDQPPQDVEGAILPNFIKEDYLTTTNTKANCKNTRESIAAALYAGFPTDGCGYREQYGLTEDAARVATQSVIWLILGEEDLSIYTRYTEPYSEYSLALLCYAAKHNSYYGQSTDLTLNGSTQLSLADGVWKTGALSVSGTFLGSIKLPTSTDIAFYDSTSGAQVTSVKTGDSFYARYIGAGIPSGVYDLSGSFITAKTTDFYSTDDISPQNKLYQDMVAMLPQTHSLAMNIVKDAPITTADVTFSKTAVNGTDELVGASLKVVKGTDTTGDTVESWTSTSTAKTIKLDRGASYTMVETTAPDGYEKAESITFRVTDAGKVEIKNGNDWVSQAANKVQMQDAKITKADVTFSKTAVNGTDELVGASLKVVKGTDATGDLVSSWTSTATAKKITLDMGQTYTMVETTAPDGYEKAESITFRVTDTGKVEIKNGNDWVSQAANKVQMQDAKITTADVTFSKTAVNGTDELVGASLKVVKGTDATGDTVESWTSTATAKKITLDMGQTYTMVETTAPDGYDKAESITFRVTDDGKVEIKNGNDWVSQAANKVQMQDAKITTSDVTFSKTAVNGTDELVGAALKVVKGSDTTGEEVSSWTSTATAKKITLDMGQTYTMVETTAPDGYEKAESITFRVTDAGKVEIKNGNDWVSQAENKVHMEDAAAPGTITDNGDDDNGQTTVTNKTEESTTIPKTGDSSHLVAYAMILLICGAALIYAAARKKSGQNARR